MTTRRYARCTPDCTPDCGACKGHGDQATQTISAALATLGLDALSQLEVDARYVQHTVTYHDSWQRLLNTIIKARRIAAVSPSSATLPADQTPDADSDRPDLKKATEDLEQTLVIFTAEWHLAVDDDERTEALEDFLDSWYTAWPDTAVTSPHLPIAGEIIRLLGPWKADNNTTQPSKITDVAEGADEIGSPRRAGRVRIERVHRATAGPDIAVRFYLDEGHAVTTWMPEDLADALDAELGLRPPQPGETPETVEADDARPQPTDLTNGAERPADAARRYAGELERLSEGLAARGITVEPGLPVDEAPVTTALAELDATRSANAAVHAKLTLTAAIWKRTAEGRLARLDGILLHLEQVEAERDQAREQVADLRQDLRRLTKSRDAWAAGVVNWYDIPPIDDLDGYGRIARFLRDKVAELVEVRRQRDKAERIAEDRGEALDRAEAEAKEHRAQIQHLGDRLAHLTSDQPTEAEYGAAQAAILLVGRRAESVDYARAALDAAWKVNRAPHDECHSCCSDCTC